MDQKSDGSFYVYLYTARRYLMENTLFGFAIDKAQWRDVTKFSIYSREVHAAIL